MQIFLKTLWKWLAGQWVLPHGEYKGRCVYCGQDNRQLQEVEGPLGRGGVFVFHECAGSCIAVRE